MTVTATAAANDRQTWLPACMFLATALLPLTLISVLKSADVAEQARAASEPALTSAFKYMGAPDVATPLAEVSLNSVGAGGVERAVANALPVAHPQRLTAMN